MVAVASTRNDVTFEYEYAKVDEVIVNTVPHQKTGKPVVSNVVIADEAHQPSDRFFTSLFSRFGFGKQFFKFFDHKEVFQRITERCANDQLRLCIERSTNGAGKRESRLLAVSNPTKPIVGYDELIGMLGDYRGTSVSYNDGIVESHHAPRVGATPFAIGPDEHSNRFVINCPVDGYGMPSVYLALFRLVCENGMIAMTRMFRSNVSLGKGDDNINFALTRVLDQFSNDEGFAALRQRIEAAQMSWCSVAESQKLYKLLTKLHSSKDGAPAGINTDGVSLESTPSIRKALTRYNDKTERETTDEVGGRIMTAFHGMTGDTTQLYGLANVDSLSIKRQQTLPVNCTVYDAINFATEIATHHALPNANRELNSWVGNLLTDEYDMEQTKVKFADFKDFHMNSKLTNQMTGSK